MRSPGSSGTPSPSGPRTPRLFVDQMEEMFTQGAPAGDIALFLQALAAAAAGHTWESPELLPSMARAVRSEPAALPLLQFAGQMLWERRDRATRTLTLAAYEQIGGVEGALARHADSVLAGMSPDEVTMVRKLLLRLVTPQNTRRVVERSDLVHGLDPICDQVLRTLVDARMLVTRGRAVVSAHAAVEIVHEALSSQWGRLSRWLEDEREELGFLQEVEEAAALWERRGRRNEEVWRGDALRDALRRTGRTTRELPAAVRDFLAACVARDSRAMRRARLAVAAAMVGLAGVAVVLAAQNREARARRADAQVARTLAEAKRAEALYEGARAALDRSDPLEARVKLRSALELWDVRLTRPLWWSLQRTPMRWTAGVTSATNFVAISPDGRWVAVGGNDGTVFQIDPQDRSPRPLRGVQGQISALAFNAAGALDACTWSGQLLDWDLGRHQLRVVREPEPSATRMALDPLGRWIASWRDDGLVRMLDSRTGAAIRQWQPFDEPVTTMEFDATGARVAAGSASGAIRVFDSVSGNLLHAWHGHDGSVARIRFRVADQALLSVGADARLRVYDLSAAREMKSFPARLGRITGAAFNKTGTLLAFGGPDKDVVVLDTGTGELRAALRGHRDDPYRVAFHPTDNSLVSTSTAKDVIYWDLDRYDDVLTAPHGHGSEIHGLSISPDGSLIATGGTDQTIRWWDAETGSLLRVSMGAGSRVNCLAFRNDGAYLLSGALDGAIRLWDPATGLQIRSLESGDPVMGAAWSLDGKRIVSAHLRGTLRVWASETGRLLKEIGSDAIRMWALDLDSDGKLLLWPGAAEPARELLSYDGRLTSARFHPDGRRIAVSGARGLAMIVDAETGVRVQLRGHRHRDVNIATFKNGGDVVATTGDDGTLRIWRTDDGWPLWRAPVLSRNPLALLTHRGWVSLGAAGAQPPSGAWVASTPIIRLSGTSTDGATMCTLMRDGTVELWRLDDGTRRFSARVGAESVQVVATSAACVVRTTDGLALRFSAEGNPGGTRGEPGPPCGGGWRVVLVLAGCGAAGASTRGPGGGRRWTGEAIVASRRGRDRGRPNRPMARTRLSRGWD